MVVLWSILLSLCLSSPSHGSCDRMKNTLSQFEQGIFLKGGVGDLDYAREGTYKQVFCCAHNYTRMMWEFKQHSETEWQQFPWYPLDYPDGLWLEEMNQTLSIKRVEQKYSGKYRCRAYNDSDNLIGVHQTELKVYSCQDRVKPLAFGPQNQYGSVGQTVAFTCSGDFGCTSDSLQDVSWYDADWEFLNEKDPRYKVSTIKRNEGTQIQSIFTISNVSERDFGQNFTCFVSSAYPDGNELFVAQLLHSSVAERSLVFPASLVSIAVVGVVVLLLVIIVIAVFYHPIKLFIYSRLPFGNLESLGDNDYHVFILLDDQDVRIAEKIKKRLEADSYIVKTSESILANQDIMQMIPEYANRSKSLIIIHPTSYERSQNSNFERLCGITEYFKENLITVIKDNKYLDSSVDTLTDKTLVSLVLPSHRQGMCASLGEKTFYSKLKLRLPNPRKKHRQRYEPTKNNQMIGEEGNQLVAAESPKRSPVNGENFRYGDEGNHVV